MSRTTDERSEDRERDPPEFGEKGPEVVDADAGKSEDEKLEEAVEDLKSDPA